MEQCLNNDGTLLSSTYMLSGAFRHEDHKGHKGTLNPGDVQWMQAGKGIVHSEMPLHEEGKGDPTGMQLWVDLPRVRSLCSSSTSSRF